MLNNLATFIRRGAFAALTAAALGGAQAAEIHVLTSGGTTEAVQALAPAFEGHTGTHVIVVLGPSMGTAPQAIPARLDRGEPADVLLMVGSALDKLVASGATLPGSRVPIADSKIALAVKAGAPVPDISTLDGFKRALLGAKSIAYSDSASGVYIEKEMYKRLGLENELAPKSRMIVAEPVGRVVARGDAEVGFQQVAELKPVSGISIAGEIPPEVQLVTPYIGAVPKTSKEPEAAKAFLNFLQTSEGRKVIAETGLAPVASGNTR